MRFVALFFLIIATFAFAANGVVCVNNAGRQVCSHDGTTTVIVVPDKKGQPYYLNKIPKELLPKLPIVPAPAPDFGNKQ